MLKIGFTCVTWFICRNSCVWRDSFMSMRQFVHRCWRLGSYVQFDSLIEIWLICRDSYVWHDSCRFTRVTDIYKCTYIHMYIYMWCTYIYIYIYTHTHRYIHIHYVYILFIYIYIYIYIYLYLHMIYIHIHLHTNMHNKHIWVSHIPETWSCEAIAGKFRKTHIHMCVRTYTYVCTLTYGWRGSIVQDSCWCVSQVWHMIYIYIHVHTHG